MEVFEAEENGLDPPAVLVEAFVILDRTLPVRLSVGSGVVTCSRSAAWLRLASCRQPAITPFMPIASQISRSACLSSDELPGVRISRSARAKTSTSAWIFLVRPPH